MEGIILNFLYSTCAEVAQLVEQRIRNAWVVSSNLILGSIEVLIVNEVIMSQHSSFKKNAGSANASQTVLKRFERIDLLKKRGQWKEGQSVLGLVKTKPEL